MPTAARHASQFPASLTPPRRSSVAALPRDDDDDVDGKDAVGVERRDDADADAAATESTALGTECDARDMRVGDGGERDDAEKSALQTDHRTAMLAERIDADCDGGGGEQRNEEDDGDRRKHLDRRRSHQKSRSFAVPAMEVRSQERWPATVDERSAVAVAAVATSYLRCCSAAVEAAAAHSSAN